MGGTQKAGVYIALLRGINVGGKNILPMKDLAGMFEKAGCEKVETYIQSGNVVFRANPALAGRIPLTVQKSIAKFFKLEIPVIVRSAGEMGRIARRNPFLKRGGGLEWLHVAFLSKTPTPAALASLDPRRSVPDEFHPAGSEIFLYCPKGLGRTKLTNAFFDSKLGCVSTMRNWKTVLKLLEMSAPEK